MTAQHASRFRSCLVIDMSNTTHANGHEQVLIKKIITNFDSADKKILSPTFVYNTAHCNLLISTKLRQAIAELGGFLLNSSHHAKTQAKRSVLFKADLCKQSFHTASILLSNHDGNCFGATSQLRELG